MANISTLALDLGPNSIGWALVNKNEQLQSIVASGVRIFPEGVDNFDTSKELSRNEERRKARGTRRQTTRRVRRKKILKNALVQSGLLPVSDTDLENIFKLDPYDLRSKAIKEKLTLHEIGRIIYHIDQRRGFKSNRKSDKHDKEVKGMLAEISELENDIESTGSSTLGNFFHNIREESRHDRIRNRHTHRAMYINEFHLIWDAQQKFYPEILTDKLKYGNTSNQEYPVIPQILNHKSDYLTEYGLFGIIFFQRKVYWPKSVIGLCELEPKQKRCPKADRAYQRFRLLQEINNLRIIDENKREERRLTDDERKLLLDKLSHVGELTFDKMRTALGFLESVHFNLERGARKKLLGAPIDSRLANKKAFGKSWHNRPSDEKDTIVRQLIDPDRNDSLLEKSTGKNWDINPTQIEYILGLDLQSKESKGYAHLSLIAINKLLPFMEQGLLYMAESDPELSALHAAGYLRRDELKLRIFDKLPDPARTTNCPIGDIPNPIVKRTLTEVRKVVNSIIRTYGKPDHVHIETARSLKMSHDKRVEFIKANREREDKRNEAADFLRENNIKITRDSINRYLMWQEQKKECAYTGKTIGLSQLFSSEIDVDHILPYSRSLDNSQMNKVLCFRSANHEKGDRTPHEWLADSDPNRYETICQKARKLPYPKRQRFFQKELDLDEFVSRQLNDTAYITKVTLEYLRCLFEKDHAVLGLKGQHTADLRWQWGLHTILQQLPDSPAWQKEGTKKLNPGEKDRSDHRHHAIDAIVLALTDRSRLQQLARIRREGGTLNTGEVLPDPWDNFRNDVIEVIKNINVSHRNLRKIRGKLHEDTIYGKTETPDIYVMRKHLKDGPFSYDEIENIRVREIKSKNASKKRKIKPDKTIRGILKQRLHEHGIELGKGKKITGEQWKKAVLDPDNPLTMPSGVPIKKVRILKKDKTIQPIRIGKPGEAHIKPGNTHHVCIFEWKNEKGKTIRDAVFITLLQAIQRLKNKQPVINRKHPTQPDAEFIMSLSKGEMVLGTFKGQERLAVYKTGAATQGQMYFADHRDARKSSDYQKFAVKASTLNARKVTVTPLGQIRWAND